MITSFLNFLKKLFGIIPSTPPAVPVSPPFVPPMIPPSTYKPAPALTRFDKACRYTMENEDGVKWDHDNGEFTNNPKDPGGATMWGIIKTEYEGFLGKTLTIDQVKVMPRETAMAIYKKNFWEPIHGDAYSSDAAAMAIFDTAVNKGLGGCMVILEDVLSVYMPSRYGPEVISAVNRQTTQEFLIAMEAATERYIDKRIAKYPQMSWARNGWIARAKRLITLQEWNP